MNLEHKKIFEFVANRNLNTNPLDTGDILDGDLNDYFVEAEFGNQAIGCTFNNDSTANYRYYYMRGATSFPTAFVLESNTEFDLSQYSTGAQPQVSRTLITGNSSEERYVDSFDGGSGAGSEATVVRKCSFYWKDVLNKLTSIQFNGVANKIIPVTIRIYQIPKSVNLDQYDLVDEVVDVDLSLGSHVFGGVNGDVDGEYLITSSGDNAGSVFYRLNSSATSNRTSQRMDNTNGAIGAVPQTVSYDGLGQSCRIFAKSGQERLCISSASKTSADQQDERGIWNPDLVTNVTNIEAYGTVVADKISLYKKKPHKTIDPVPMDTLFEYEVDGVDFSGGITINNLQGDRFEGAFKIEVFDFVGNSDITMQMQGVTSNSNQSLQGITSGTSATPSSPNKPIISNGSTSVNSGETWCYLKSGQNRPCLNKQVYNKNSIQFNYITINESVTEVNQCLIQAATATTVQCTIRVSVPKGTTWTTKPTLTVN